MPYRDSFFSALSFLTVIRPRTEYIFSADKAVYSFALVGFLIGLGLAILSAVGGAAAPVLMLIYLTVITGFLHMDGLADTFDALFSHRDKKTMLKIMKDSRIGAMGAAALALCFIGKFQAFSHIDNIAYLVAIPAIARFCMAATAGTQTYVRDNGLGKAFVKPVTPHIFIQLIPAQLVLLVGCGLHGLLMINLAALVLTLGILYWYNIKLGGITGDLLGALNEITETSLFLMVII